MNDWFEPLLLVTLISGYIFLFLQGRVTRLSQLKIERELDDLREERAAWTRPAPAELAPVTAPLAPVLELPDFRPDIDLLREELAQERQEVLETRAAVLRGEVQMAALAEAMDSLPERMQSARAAVPPPPPVVLSPEEVARKFLLEEGFSRVHLVGSDLKDGGVRFLVRALRGDEVRSGYVLVKDGGVLDAGLKVPTAIFP